MKPQLLSTVLAFLLTLCASSGDVSLAPLFRDGAVFQRGKPVPVWGKARPGEAISVTFGPQSKRAVADQNGRWMLYLDEMGANTQPESMIVRGDNELTVSDILVGEVWFCSGQSNMNWQVSMSLDASKEIASADNPLIRCFGVRNEVEETPQEDSPGKWLPATPQNVGDFSAVAYFFARELQPQIGVPVGIIKATPGGSAIEAWMSPKSLAVEQTYPDMLARRRHALAVFPQKKKEYDQALARWRAEEEKAKAQGTPFSDPKPRVPEGPLSRNAPSGLYNSNVFPFAPYAIRGFLWYQGEANASRYAMYRRLFPAMIEQWRDDFKQGDLPFYFVQLANYDLKNDPTGGQWAFQREAQSVALELPNTAMIVAVDIGEPGNIHPKNKQEVGRRLSLVARKHLYGENAEVDGEGPRAVAFSTEGRGIRVEVACADTPLEIRGGKVDDMEIAGPDQVFHPADVRLEGDSLLVSSDAVYRPVAVRYLWSNSPQATIFSLDGLPLAPFRSDDW